MHALTHRPTGRIARLAGAIQRSLCLGVLALSPLVQASPLSTVGINAFGNADYLFQVCATFACTPAGGSLSTQSDGGNGANSAAVGYLGGFGNGAQFQAAASFSGGLQTPVLTVMARTAHQFGPHPGYSEDGGYDFNASASAAGVQHYTYTGSVAANYEFTFRVDGVIDPALASVFAFAGMFDVDNTLGGELPLGMQLDSNALLGVKDPALHIRVYVLASARLIGGPAPGNSSVGHQSPL